MQKPLNVKRLARNVNQNLSKVWTFVQKEKNLEVFHRFNELRVNELNSAKCHTWSNIEPDRPELGSIRAGRQFSL